MGLFDLPAPLFGVIDALLANVLPGLFRLALWGLLSGWLTMVVYRQISNQKQIHSLKLEQREQQKRISEFDGEMGELFPLIRHTLGLGMKQLGLSLGPALLATVPVLFIIVWVAGNFGHEFPSQGSAITVTINEDASDSDAIQWVPGTSAVAVSDGWQIAWPKPGQQLSIFEGDSELLQLPPSAAIPVIHKKRWWNVLMANPIGYLPEQSQADQIRIELPQQAFIGLGPQWMRGWMFSFFLIFLLSSVAFKLILRID